VANDRIPIPTLTPLIQEALRARAAALGLRADRLREEHVLNWGGFGSASYTVWDGTRQLHVKVSPDAGDHARLRHWQQIHRLLEERYHAPALLDWLEVPGTAYQGPVFAFVDGTHLDGFRTPRVLEDVLRVVGLLHADPELAQHLRQEGPTRSCFDCLVSRYTGMLREDLDGIRAEPPPFVRPDRLRWMSEQVDVLEQLAQGSGAFSGPAHAVVHGDLWWNNLLVASSGAWYLLDWDDVSLGDPAVDYAALLFPFTCGPALRPWQDFPIPTQDEAFPLRMALYRRAQVLDGVIDVLADWIDAREVPAAQAEVRTRKQAEHEHFLRVYEAEYGRSSGSGPPGVWGACDCFLGGSFGVR
jgi:hypothetical protein